MYGTSEAVIGHCLDELGHPRGLFSATKGWTWLEANPLTVADLEREKGYLKQVGYELRFS